MLASTKVLTAGPLLRAIPLVVTVNGVGVPRVPVQLALPVTWPGVGEVNVTVHWPAASVAATTVNGPGVGDVAPLVLDQGDTVT